MDVVVGLIARVGYSLISPVGSKIKDAKDYHENMSRLHDLVERLDGVRQDVQQSVNTAVRNGGAIKVAVSNWLKEVDDIIEVAREMHAEYCSNKKCLKGLSPNWFAHYKLSQMALQKILVVSELLSQKLDDDVSILLPPLNIGILSESHDVPLETVVHVDSNEHQSESAGSTVSVGTLPTGSPGNKVGAVLNESEPNGQGNVTAGVSKEVVLQTRNVDEIHEIIDQHRGSVNHIMSQQREAVVEIFDTLHDENCEAIEVCGMGGIGKTTLVKEIGKMARDSSLFDNVVFAVVSQTLDVRKVQGQIGDMLGLRFSEESEMGRAGRLYRRLSDERTLLILDDVWAYVNLMDIGIPLYDGKRGCKILITTRQRSNRCITGHHETKKVPLRLLSEEETWDLFRINAGLNTDSESGEQCVVAKEVSVECSGLPLAIITVGRALRDRSLDDWKAALQQLKKSKPLNMNNVEKDVFTCLELSYNNLKSEKAKQCFLLCCLFPEDHDITIEVIARYAMGKGLFTDLDTIEDARGEVRWIMRNLVDSSLLMDNGDEECMRMHDVVRDFAISITSEKKYGFLVISGLGLKRLPNRKGIEQSVNISLMANSIQSLPEGLNCPRLEMLLLGKNEGFMKIADGYFRGMNLLRVLDLSESVGVQADMNYFSGLSRGKLRPRPSRTLHLPSSFEALVNLRTLYLDHCKLDDIAILGKLEKLKVLSLYGCDIEELPKEIGALVDLKLLDLNFCQNLKFVPSNLIASLHSLEELYMAESFTQWAVEDEGCKAALSEMTSLSYLSRLCVQVPNPQAIPRNFLIPNLQKFELIIGGQHNSITCYPNSRSLYLEKFEAKLPEGAKGILKNTESLTMFCSSSDVLSEILDSDLRDLNSVKYLKIEACGRDFSLLRGQPHDVPVLPALETLHLRMMDDLSGIFSCTIQKLRILHVDNCHKLILPVVQMLHSLENVEVRWCKLLFCIFYCRRIAPEKEDCHPSNLRVLRLSYLPGVRWIWKDFLPSVSLRNLTEVTITQCENLTYLFPSSVAQNLWKLKILCINSCDRFQSLVGDRKGVSDNPDQALCLPSLETIELRKCPNVKSLFAFSDAKHLHQLQEIKLSSCDQMNEVISYGSNGEEENEDVVVLLPKLSCVEIKDMPNMARLFAVPFGVHLPSLKKLIAANCPRIENFPDLSKDGMRIAPSTPASTS